MARSNSDRELGEAYGLGVADTEARLLPFDHVSDVYFARDRPQLEAALEYERRLVAKLEATEALLRSAVMMRNRSVQDERGVAERGRERVRMAGGSSRVTRILRRGVARIGADRERQDAGERTSEDVDRVQRLEGLQRRLLQEIGDVGSWLDEQVSVLERIRERRSAELR